MNYTENLHLKKPEQTDVYDVGDFNDNCDTLDAYITDELVAPKAKKFETKRNLLTELSSNDSAQFDGSADASIGVHGILPISHGGTGTNSASDARANLGLQNGATLKFTYDSTTRTLAITS